MVKQQNQVFVLQRKKFDFLKTINEQNKAKIDLTCEVNVYF